MSQSLLATWGLPIAQFGLIIAVVYFMLIRPGSQARKDAMAMHAGLKKNDEVTTAGGLVGRIKDLKDNLITIESGTATVVVERSRIVRVGTKQLEGVR